MGEVFFLETQNICPKAQQNTLLVDIWVVGTYNERGSYNEI